MTFQEITQHCESYGCNYDHLRENIFEFRCVVSGNICMVENIEEYSTVTLMHYFFELGIPSPSHLSEQFQAYREMRDGIGQEATLPVDE